MRGQVRLSIDAIIDVRGVSKHFGGLTAVSDCSLKVERGSVTGLIGPNGAGKTTLFNVVAGTLVPDSGQIIFDGTDVTGLKPHELFERGMLRTFQIAHEFSQMTALENLMMVPGEQPGESLSSTWFKPSLRKPYIVARPCRQYRTYEQGAWLYFLCHRARHGFDRQTL